MRRSAAVALFIFAATARAHPGHGEAAVHLHGFNPEMIVLALLFAAWALLRSR